MNASEKNSFEEQWRKAFEDAEDTPGPAVWANIEAHLADAEAARYKRKLVALRWRMAAAVALLVLATGTWAWWSGKEKTNAGVAVTSPAQPSGPTLERQPQAGENPARIAQSENATGGNAPSEKPTNGLSQGMPQPDEKGLPSGTHPLTKKDENIAKTPRQPVDNTLADKRQSDQKTIRPAERPPVEKTPPTGKPWVAKRQSRKTIEPERKSIEKQAFEEKVDENSVAVVPSKQPDNPSEKPAVETPTAEQPIAESDLGKNAENATSGDNRAVVELLAA
nr:hypothetical protein [Cytophagales bacterium]